MKKQIVFLLILFWALAACKQDPHFTTLEEAIGAHKYTLAEEYKPDWTIDDITWVIDGDNYGHDCKPTTYYEDGFCYGYQVVIFTIGDIHQVHVQRSDYFILIKDDPTGWQYASWL